MPASLGFGAERIGVAALKYPRAASLLLLLIIGLIAATLPRVSFDNNVNRVFLSENAISESQRRFEQEQSPPTSTALIRISSASMLTSADLTAIRALALQLGRLDGVTTVASAHSLRWPLESGARFGRYVLPSTIDESFPEDLDEFEAMHLGLPSFVNSDRSALILSVLVDTSQAQVPAVIDAIDQQLSSSLPENLSARVTGEDIINAEIVSGLKKDLVSLNLFGAVLISFAAFVLLRDARMALLAVTPALIGASGVLALSVWLGYPITVLSNVIPILILVLGVANGMHLAGHLKDGGTVHDAIQTVAPACALTAFTTMIAFASIMLTSNEQMFEFAVLGALGTLLAFSIVIATFALLGRVISVSSRPVPQVSAVFAQRLARLGSSWPRVTVVTCLALLVVATIGFNQTRAWFPLYQNLPDNSATIAINDAIAEDFGGVFTMIVETSGDWEQITSLVTTLEDISGPQTVFSALSIARWFGHPDIPATDDEYDKLPSAFTGALRGANNTSRIFVSVPEPMRNEQTLLHFDTLYTAARDAGASQIFGLPTIMRKEAVTLIEQLSLSLVLATLGAVLICAFAFRSASLIPILLVPNVLPLLLTGASLHLWTSGQLSPTAALALTIAFGIAVDDTVHFLSRFSAARTRGESSKDAVISATRAAGQAIVLTTLLLTVGLSVTVISDFTPIRLFGAMMIVTLWAALLIDLLLIPALLTWKRTQAPVEPRN